MVCLSKAADGARLAEMVRLITEDVRKIRFDFPRGYQTFFAEMVRFPKIFCLSNRALFLCLHIQPHLNTRRVGRILPTLRVLK